MTTLVPHPPYTQDELDSLYPKTLKLQLVQIVSQFSVLGVSLVNPCLCSFRYPEKEGTTGDGV